MMSRQQLQSLQHVDSKNLQLLDDEDDGVTCRMCLQPFWYKSQLHDHLKSMHSIKNPGKYERAAATLKDFDLKFNECQVENRTARRFVWSYIAREVARSGNRCNCKI